MDDGLAVALFRHGLTDWNEKKAYIGSTDLPLSKQGKVSLSSKADEEYEIIFSSPMKRCVQTAARLFPSHTPVIIPEFKEINFGDWEGKTYNELKDDQLYRDWIDDPKKITPANGESFVDFEQRVTAGWKEVLEYSHEKSYSKVAVVTHGGVIRQILSKLSNQPDSFFTWQVPYGSGYQLIWKPSDRKGDKSCISSQEAPIMEKLTGLKNIID